jgi:hypothetical protein
MAKESQHTPTDRKAGNSPFRKFEQLAKKIVRAPKSSKDQKPNTSVLNKP